MELKKMLFVCMLVCMTMAPVGAVDLTVDFDGGDCSREFTVSQYDVYYLKADPNPLTSGGAASCTVRFRTSSAFNIYVQSVHVQDCTAKLFFYDNDNTQKYPSQTLSCIPTVDSGGTFKTRTGNLIVRLEKGSGSTKAYSFTVVLTTIEGQSVSDQVTDTAGGGVGTGAIIGIAVGVVAFLIIIIAVVCFFVCRQMAQQKEEKMRQQPSIFATASSRLATSTSASRPNSSGSQQFNRPASIRRHPRSPRIPVSQGFENKAFSETSNGSTDFVESKVSYAIMSDTSVDGKSSIRFQNQQKGLKNGSVGRDRSTADKGLSDDARSSVKFDLRSDSELARKSAPKFGTSRREQSTTPKTTTVHSTRNKENVRLNSAKQPAPPVDKPKISTTEGKNYFREYNNKGYEDDLQRSASLRKSKNRETSSSSHNSSYSNRHLDERPRDDKPRRSRSRSESRRDTERYRESESDDYYREHRHRSRSADRSHRRSDSRSRRRDEYYDDYESDSDYRDGHRRSRSTDRRSNRSPDRKSDSRHRSRSDYYDDYRSDDSFIRSSRRNDNRSGYRSDNRYDTRGSYRRDKRDGYRSDNRYDNRGGYRSDNRYDREGYKNDNRYDHRERTDSYRDRERRNRSAPRDRSDSYRSRATSVGSSYSRARSTGRYDRY